MVAFSGIFLKFVRRPRDDEHWTLANNPALHVDCLRDISLKKRLSAFGARRAFSKGECERAQRGSKNKGAGKCLERDWLV